MKAAGAAAPRATAQLPISGCEIARVGIRVSSYARDANDFARINRCTFS
jgi:hypothetical protein